jgi:hypothetical protein
MRSVNRRARTFSTTRNGNSRPATWWTRSPVAGAAGFAVREKKPNAMHPSYPIRACGKWWLRRDA